MVDGIISSVGGVGGASKDNIFFSDSYINEPVDMTGKGFLIVANGSTSSTSSYAHCYLASIRGNIQMTQNVNRIRDCVYYFETTGNSINFTKFIGPASNPDNFTEEVSNAKAVEFSIGAGVGGILMCIVR